MNNRTLITAIIAALAVFFVYNMIYSSLYPAATPPAPDANDSLVESSPPPGAVQPGDDSTAGDDVTTSQPAIGAPSTPKRGALRFESTGQPREVVLGGEAAPLRVKFTTRGASVETIELTKRKKNGQYVHRAKPVGNEPYLVVEPQTDANGAWHNSFETPRLLLPDRDNTFATTTDTNWQLVSSDAHQVVFGATLIDGSTDAPVLRLTKSYQLSPDKPILTLSTQVKNLSERPLKYSLDQAGPTGIPREQINYAMRRIVAGGRNEDGEVALLGHALPRQSLQREKPHTIYTPQTEQKLVWAALANKYFGVFVRPLPQKEGELNATFVQRLTAWVLNPTSDANLGDFLLEFTTAARPVDPGQTDTLQFEIYAGTKDMDDLAALHAAYADRMRIGLSVARDADTRGCCCTFSWLKDLMVNILHGLYSIVRNYGVAIMILVVIVRTLLHPLTVFQQKSMYKMQESMGRIQPKIQKLKEQYKDDKVAMNQAMMDLYAKENVNPMAGMVGMVPMLIQMPILIALWTGLNTDVHLRHAPFDGWWIKDLASPDALIKFGSPIDIPVLSWLPLIGAWFTQIPAINALPILMGVSMWLQQKYMPKPGMEAKLEAARKAAESGEQPQSGGGFGNMTPEEQMRQQQMMANMMSVMFPIMFYYMPAGLNLYWLATNVFGILESMRIRKQLKEEKERRELLGPEAAKPKKPGFMAGIMKRIAEQAEELQKQADEVSQHSGKTYKKNPKQNGGKPGPGGKKKGK